MNVMLRTVDKAPAAEAQAALISETLAGFAHDLAPGAIPAEVRERAKHLILDATGIALASGRYDFAHKAATAISGLGGTGDVPVIGLPLRLAPRDAALLNGILVHGLDFDDSHTGGLFHATASIWPRCWRPPICAGPRAPISSRPMSPAWRPQRALPPSAAGRSTRSASTRRG